MTNESTIHTRERAPFRARLMLIVGLAFATLMPSVAAAADPLPIKIEIPTEQSAAPYGGLLGKPFPTGELGAGTFKTPTGVQVWRQDVFDAGTDGKADIAWVIHKGAEPVVNRFEQHHLTEQAVIPLTGDLIQIVALSGPDGAPDLATIKAFRLTPGIGLNMGRDVWHASRSNGVTLVMLTRSTTSTDMAKFQNKQGPLQETALRETAPIRLVDPI